MKKFAGALFAAAALCAPMAVHGQTYPNKVVRIVVPYPPGGTVDAIARVIAQRLSESLGQQFIVDNRPGASGTIGSTAVAKSPADGYTPAGSGVDVRREPAADEQRSVRRREGLHARHEPGVGAVARDGISGPTREEPQGVPQSPSRRTRRSTCSGPPRWARRATSPRRRSEYEAKVDFTILPYKGTSPALIDVMGGHISAMVDALPSTMPHVKSGKLKPLAVTTAKRVRGAAGRPDRGRVRPRWVRDGVVVRVVGAA